MFVLVVLEEEGGFNGTWFRLKEMEFRTGIAIRLPLHVSFRKFDNNIVIVACTDSTDSSLFWLEKEL